MRILFINHTGKVSGAEIVLLQMLRGLPRKTYDVELLAGADGPLIGLAEAIQIRVTAMPELSARLSGNIRSLGSAVVSFCRSALITRAHVRRVQPDLIHANTIRAGIVASLATIGLTTPVIWHVHDILPEHYLSRVIRLFAQSSQRIFLVFVSVAAARALQGRAVTSNRHTVLHNGVQLNQFPRKTDHASDRYSFRRALAIPDDACIFVAVGQIAARKGLKELIGAFHTVACSDSRAHLVVVGQAIFHKDQLYCDDLRALTKELKLNDRVHFSGARSDVAAVLRGSDALVLNSLQEPFGLVLIEAMASGTVVIATAVGGIPEVVTDGVTGWLVPAQNESALSSRMIWVAQRPKQSREIEQVAYQEVCERFTEERFLQQLESTYRRVFTLE